MGFKYFQNESFKTLKRRLKASGLLLKGMILKWKFTEYIFIYQDLFSWVGSNLWGLFSGPSGALQLPSYISSLLAALEKSFINQYVKGTYSNS